MTEEAVYKACRHFINISFSLKRYEGSRMPQVITDNFGYMRQKHIDILKQMPRDTILTLLHEMFFAHMSYDLAAINKPVMCFSCKKSDDYMQNCKVNGKLTAKLEDTVRCEGCIDYTPSKTRQSIQLNNMKELREMWSKFDPETFLLQMMETIYGNIALEDEAMVVGVRKHLNMALLKFNIICDNNANPRRFDADIDPDDLD